MILSAGRYISAIADADRLIALAPVTHSLRQRSMAQYLYLLPARTFRISALQYKQLRRILLFIVHFTAR